jgi:hypothetical protein
LEGNNPTNTLISNLQAAPKSETFCIMLAFRKVSDFRAVWIFESRMFNLNFIIPALENEFNTK